MGWVVVVSIKSNNEYQCNHVQLSKDYSILEEDNHDEKICMTPSKTVAIKLGKK